MAESRIEKFREYRKSIVRDDISSKTPIETSLETTSTVSDIEPTEREIEIIKKIKRRKNTITILFSIVVGGIIISLVAFGIILFR